MKIVAGLPFKKTFALPEYLESDGWSISGYLSNAQASEPLAESLFESTSSGWELSLTSAFTAAMPVGAYTVYLIATNDDGEEELAATLSATVEAMGTASHNATMVAAIRALMEGRPTHAYESYTTEDGESISRLDPEKLQKWLSFYERRLDAEQRMASGTGRVRNIQIGFGS